MWYGNYAYIIVLVSNYVGAKLLSTDMIVSIYMGPMIKAYQYHDYDIASNILYQYNGFMLGFGFGIVDLPQPMNPDRTDITDRRNPEGYYKMYYEKYAPLASKELGRYQREVLDYIKEERGTG